MTNILFGMAIGIAMSASILGAYRWMVWHGYILKPSRKVRELVDEYARLKAEHDHVLTLERAYEIEKRMMQIDLRLSDLGYCLQKTLTAAYVFPIADYYVATFGEGKKRDAHTKEAK